MSTKIRPCVEQFAKEMERKLQENDHKSGWGDMDSDELFDRLRQETSELHRTVAALEALSGIKHPPACIDALKMEVTREAADVANFAMMIADNFGDAYGSGESDEHAD